MVWLAPLMGLRGQIGELAPPLAVKEWIKGKPVEITAGTNIYVVEVFASTSLASRASITNLNEIQRRFRDQGVVVVGISGESADKIKEFVAHEGAAIEYVIAVDDRRQTVGNYMLRVRQGGGPYAFVVGKEGKLLWHGHPQRGLERALEQITSGSYDLEWAQKAELARKQMGQYLDLARRGDVRAGPAGRVVLAGRTNDVAALCELAFQIATAPRLARRDVRLAAEALDQAEKLAPTNTTRVAVTRAVLMFETGKREEGLAQARQAVAAAPDAEEKANAEACLHAMEARLKAATTNQMKAATTNQMKAGSTNQMKAGTTKQIQGPADKP